MKVLILLSLVVITSCASMNQEIKGYQGASRTKVLKQIVGMTPAQAKLVLGEPAEEGMCTECGHGNGVYQMIYLNKSLPRYSFALSMANKSHLDCFIIDFRYEESKDAHVYTGPGVMDQTSCAQPYGPIASLRKMK
jgi:hypothetical protein